MMATPDRPGNRKQDNDGGASLGSSVGGVGLVFILGCGVILLGAVLMFVMYKRHPGFFRGETLRRGTAADDVHA